MSGARAMEIDRAVEYCEALTQRRESNFSLGFRLLPPEKKKAIHVVYAFCRYVDDIADENAAVAGIEGLLAQWEEELARVYGKGDPSHPIGIALCDVLRRFSIPREGFLELIEGCRMDQRRKTYPDFEALSVYCELVATSIAKVSLPVYGFHDYEKTFPPARDLSFAFQLTNILRDVKEDDARGRCYLPTADLRRFGIGLEDLFGGSRPREIAAFFRFEGGRCEAYFHRGRGVLEYLDPDSRRCVRVMIDAYHTLLQKILADPPRALEARTVLSPEEKKTITEKAPVS